MPTARPRTTFGILVPIIALVAVAACGDDDGGVASTAPPPATDSPGTDVPAPTATDAPEPDPTTTTTTITTATTTNAPGPDPTTATTDAPESDLPEGRIAFRRFDDDGLRAALFVMNLDGTELVQLTNPGPNIVDNLPSWSPDGQRLAFERQYPDRPWEVFVVNQDGTDERLVDPGCPESYPDAPICEENMPAWSPDGSRIAFGWPYGDVTPNNTIEVFAIGVMDVDGGDVQQLTNLNRPNTSEHYAPVWSPDGTRIAYVHYNIWDDPMDQAALFVMNADGSDPQQITPWELRAGDPTWSPDGTTIVFRSEPDLDRAYVGHLYVVAPDGSDLRQITDHDDDVQVYSSTFSPDGEWIAFARTGVDGEPDIFLMRSDGTDLAPITETPVWDSAPAWKPD